MDEKQSSQAQSVVETVKMPDLTRVPAVTCSVALDRPVFSGAPYRFEAGRLDIEIPASCVAIYSRNEVDHGKG